MTICFSNRIICHRDNHAAPIPPAIAPETSLPSHAWRKVAKLAGVNKDGSTEYFYAIDLNTKPED